MLSVAKMNGSIINELERCVRKWLQPNWGTILALAWRDWAKPHKISIRIAAVLVKIQTNHLQNMSAERYHYANPVATDKQN
jgi:hypothetical protein